jgi:hypothetical protein
MRHGALMWAWHGCATAGSKPKSPKPFLTILSLIAVGALSVGCDSAATNGDQGAPIMSRKLSPELSHEFAKIGSSDLHA